jgi:hypothetical protein
MNRRASAALLGLAMLSGCDPIVDVRGVVSDEKGAPLVGVAVTVEADGRVPHPDTTSADGTYHDGMIGTDPQHARVRFRKSGYVEILRPFGSETDAIMNVTMLAERPDGGAAP